MLNNLLLSGLPSLLAPFDAEPISSVPNYCPSWQFSNCLSCEESPSYLEQLVDSCLQTDAPLDPAFSPFQMSSHYTSDTFQPVPLCFNQGPVSFVSQGSSHRCIQTESGEGAEQQQADFEMLLAAWGMATAMQAACVDFCMVSHWELRTGRPSQT